MRYLCREANAATRSQRGGQAIARAAKLDLAQPKKSYLSRDRRH
jgi:hypothetical protein